MHPEAAETITCDRREVFDEDAGAFVVTGPEPVSPSRPGSSPPPAGEVREAWLKVIERFTEPVPGTKDCFRPRGPAEKRTIAILCRQPRTNAPVRLEGEELNPTDRSCLILFTTEGEAGPRVVSTLVPWSDIIHLSFPLQQPDAAQARTA